MPNQRSILSFFGSSASNDLSKPQSQSHQQQPQLQPKPPQSQSKLPPPPPPPSFNRFVPPPSARNGNGYAPPPGMSANGNGNRNANAVRHGGSPDPTLDLAPITPAYGRSIFQAAGATEIDGDGTISFPSPASNKIVFPRDIHMPDLVSINGILLPVRYSDSFYKGVTDPTRMASLFNRIILGDDGKTVVGGIVCRLEPSPFAGDSSSPGSGLTVYIQSLALLSPYRGRGLMAAALDSIIATVQALNQKAAIPGGPLATTGPVLSLFAHVWTEHDDALAWYTSRQFARQGDAPLEDYYFALRPATAWIVRRDVSAAAEVDPSVTQLVLEATQQAKKEQQQAALKAAAANSLPPPPPPPPSSSFANSRSQSYQNSRPETEWNDLPADMMTTPALSANASTAASSRNVSRKVSQINLTDGTSSNNSNKENDDSSPPPPPSGAATLLAPPGANGSQASSRSSSSAGKKKRERAYPAAMFQ